MNDEGEMKGGWMDFLRTEAPEPKVGLLTEAGKRKVAAAWVAENPEKSTKAEEYLTGVLLNGPIHASLLSELTTRFSVPKPVSSWVKTFPVFHYYSGRTDNRHNGMPAVALASRMNDPQYWDSFRTSLEADVQSHGGDPWTFLGLSANSKWGLVRFEILRAFLIYAGHTEQTSMARVATDFKRMSGMRIVEFFCGSRPGDVARAAGSDRYFEWNWSAHVPPVLSVCPRSPQVTLQALPDEARARLQDVVCAKLPEAIDFASMAEEMKVCVESVYVGYLQALQAALVRGGALPVDNGGSEFPDDGGLNKLTARRFSGIVTASCQLGNERWAVKFEQCVDDSGSALSALENVYHDFDGNFADEYGVGNKVYGQYVSDEDGRIKILSLSKKKPQYQNGSDEELEFIDWLAAQAQSLGLNCTKRDLIRLHTAAKMRVPILLSGRPGCGKRTLAEFYGRIVTGSIGPHIKPINVCLRTSDGVRIAVASDLEQVHLDRRDEFCVIELPMDNRARDLNACHELDVGMFPLGYMGKGRPVPLSKWSISRGAVLQAWENPRMIGETKCKSIADVYANVWDVFNSCGMALGHTTTRQVLNYILNRPGKADTQDKFEMRSLLEALSNFSLSMGKQGDEDWALVITRLRKFFGQAIDVLRVGHWAMNVEADREAIRQEGRLVDSIVDGIVDGIWGSADIGGYIGKIELMRKYRVNS